MTDLLRGTWQLATAGDRVRDKPVAVRVAGRELVLFRDRAGGVHSFDDRCPHRRAPLSLGRVTDDGNLQCGYHGWCFDGATGQCAGIPSYRPDERVPSRFAAVRHPAVERDGQVYVQLDDGGDRKDDASNGEARWRPGTFALRDAWFPVAHAPQVRNKSVTRQVHRQPIDLRRQNGRIYATGLRDEFTGGTGRYPVVERYGYAWVWYGNPDNAHPDLVPDVPYLPRDGKVRRQMWGTVIFDCTYELVCENLLDLTHADFVHSKWVGDSLSEEDEISVESTPETVTMIREAKGRRTPAVQRWIAKSARQDFRAVTHVHLRSGVTVLHGDYRPGLSVRLFHPNVPETPERTRLSFTFNPKRGPWLARQTFSLIAPIIGGQDNRMLKPQNPRYFEAAERADFSSRFDAADLMYRKRMKELIERQKAGDYSYQADPSADIAGLLGVERED